MRVRAKNGNLKIIAFIFLLNVLPFLVFSINSIAEDLQKSSATHSTNVEPEQISITLQEQTNAVTNLDLKNSDCECCTYKQYVDIQTLTEQILHVGVNVTSTNEAAIFNDKLEENLFRLRFDSLRFIPKKYYEQLLRKSAPQFTFKIQGNFFQSRLVPKTSSIEGSIFSKYKSLIPPIIDVACQKKTGLSKYLHNKNYAKQISWEELVEIYKNYNTCKKTGDTHFEEDANLVFADNEKVDDFNSSLHNFSFYTARNLSEREYKLIRHYHSLLYSENEEALLKTAKIISSNLSKREKLDLVSMFGDRFNEGYDNDRNNTSSSLINSEVISGNELLQNLQENTDLFITENNISSPGKAGVCRDIATMQGRILKAFGFDKTYLVSYSQIDGDPHTTVITQDPDNPNQLYRFNYGKKAGIKGGSSSALFADRRDSGLGYYLSDPVTSHPIAYIPGHTSEILAKFAGADIQEIGGDPLSRSQESLIASGIRLGENREHGIALGYAKDEFGANYVVGGYHYRFGNSDYAPGKVGIAVAEHNRPNEIFEFKNEKDMNALMAYLYYSQLLRSPILSITPTTKAWADSQAFLTVSGSTLNSKFTKTGVHAHAHLKVGLNVEQKLGPEKIRLRFESQHSPSPRDARNAAVTFSNATMTTDFYSAQAESAYKLSGLDNVYFISQLQYVGSDLGHRGMAEVGLASNRGVFTIYGESALTSDTVHFQDNANRKIAGKMMVRFINDHATVTLSPYLEWEDNGRYIDAHEWDNDADPLRRELLPSHHNGANPGATLNFAIEY